MIKGTIITVAGVLLAVYVAAAPYITVYQMKSAAETLDGEALSEHIDFPSVRLSLKEQLKVMVMKEMAKNETESNGFALVAGAVVAELVDRSVDIYVTPAGISQLIAGEAPGPTDADDSNNSSGNTPAFDPSMSYESLNKFVVTLNGGTDEERRLILRRRGIGWKLTEFIVPTDYFENHLNQ